MCDPFLPSLPLNSQSKMVRNLCRLNWSHYLSLRSLLNKYRNVVNFHQYVLEWVKFRSLFRLSWLNPSPMKEHTHSHGLNAIKGTENNAYNTTAWTRSIRCHLGSENFGECQTELQVSAKIRIHNGREQCTVYWN